MEKGGYCHRSLLYIIISLVHVIIIYVYIILWACIFIYVPFPHFAARDSLRLETGFLSR